MLEAGAIRRLIEYYNAVPDCSDLLHGPLYYDDLRKSGGPHIAATHMKDTWGPDRMRGQWSVKQDGIHPLTPPYEIPGHGLGLFSCRKEAWPGFHPALKGFGGEEMNVHDLFRKLGRKAVCLPFLRWVHRFGDAQTGTEYPNLFDDRFRNYVIWARVLGKDPGEIVEKFENALSLEKMEEIVREVEQYFWQPKAS
jgi:hypothetical protein